MKRPGLRNPQPHASSRSGHVATLIRPSRSFFWRSSGVLLAFFCVIEHQKNARRTPEEHQKNTRRTQKNPEEPRRRRTPAPPNISHRRALFFIRVSFFARFIIYLGGPKKEKCSSLFLWMMEVVLRSGPGQTLVKSFIDLLARVVDG